MPIPALIVAGLLALLTWAVVHKTCRDHPILGTPLIPLCVAGLSFMGLGTMGTGLVESIPLLYTALALAILLVLLFTAFQGRLSQERRNTHLHDIQSKRRECDENNSNPGCDTSELPDDTDADAQEEYCRRMQTKIRQLKEGGGSDHSACDFPVETTGRRKRIP